MRLNEIAGIDYVELADKHHINRDDWTQHFQWMETIKKDCQPYLQRVDNRPFTYPMYRGMKDNSGRFHTITPRLSGEGRKKARRPASTSKEAHDEMNDYLEEHYGHRYRDGVFVTSEADSASYYGTIMQVFPIGDFDFLWSPDIHDLYNDTVTGRPVTQDVLDSFMQGDLRKAIESGNEIMLWTPKYYAMYGTYRNPLEVKGAFQEILGT